VTDDAFFAGLRPELAALAVEHRERCRAQGLHTIWPADAGFRSAAKQIEKYAIGRRNGPYGWVTVDPTLIVTNALPAKAPHCRGAAYDMVPLNDYGRVDWQRLDLFYRMVQLMPAGLVWGGTFPIHDCDHFELVGWKKLGMPEMA
jgi:hypothetical protein